MLTFNALFRQISFVFTVLTWFSLSVGMKILTRNWTKSIKRSEIGSHVTFPHKTWKHCELTFWFAEAPGMVFLTSNGTKSSQNNHINSFFGSVHPLVEVKWQNTFLSSDKLFEKGWSYQWAICENSECLRSI